jgi:hypothetical protein
MKKLNININILKLLFPTMVLFVCVNFLYAQPGLPQRTITVSAAQAIHFGTLSAGPAGGTVTVGYDGSKSSTGSITLLAVSPVAQPAIFDIKLCQGRNVNISAVPTVNLNGSNGGVLTLDIGPTEYGALGVTFQSVGDCNTITPIRVGGTLHIPAATIPGTYTGSFNITFNQE